MTQERRRYIRAIRNDAKRRYAEAYAAWLDSGRRGPEPDRGSLSYMGAQSVWMALEGMLR